MGDDEKLTAAANRAVEQVAARARAFADRHMESSSAAMLAVQAEINLQRWIDALRRLNDLAERFPRNPSVHRGFNAVYVAWYIQTRDRDLVEEAARALGKATDLDPRDARTAMDSCQLARVAGDLGSALKHAQRARVLESRPGGPASRMLGDLHLALGYKALDGGEVEKARQSLLAARQVNPSRAGSWILEGQLVLKSPSRDRFVRAFDLAKKAKGLEPLPPGGQQAHGQLPQGQRHRPPCCTWAATWCRRRARPASMRSAARTSASTASATVARRSTT